MSKEGAWQSFDKLIAEVREHLNARNSGSLCIRSADNHWACIVVDEGRIAGLMCRGARGIRSIKHFQNIKHCTFRFDAGAVLATDSGDLPGTEDILRQLEGEASVEEHRPIGLSVHDLQQVVRDAASELLGPMGEIVCDEEFARARILGQVDDVEQLVRGISREISDPEEAHAFRERVMTGLSGSGISTMGTAPVAPQNVTPIPEINRVRDLITAEAAEFLGPVGPVLAERYFREYSGGRSVADLALIVTSLMDDIGDNEQGRVFKERIEQCLQAAG